MNNNQYRILCVDACQEACNEVISLLDKVEKNYDLTSALSPNNALRLIEKHPFDLYLIDCLLTGEEINGLELCRRIRLNDAETPIIFFGPKGDDVTRINAVKYGADQFLIKSDEMDQLEEVVEQLLTEKQIWNEMKSDLNFNTDKPARIFSFI